MRFRNRRPWRLLLTMTAQRSTQGSGTHILSPSEGADSSASGVEGSLFRVDPSPRLGLGTFNGRRPSRESLYGNGAGAPPVSRFLYRPHYRRTKSESQHLSLYLHGYRSFVDLALSVFSSSAIVAARFITLFSAARFSDAAGRSLPGSGRGSRSSR